MTDNKFYLLLMTFILLGLGYLTYQIISPFLSAIMWAIVVSIIFYPLYALILRLVRFKPLASLLTLIAILIIIFGPFSYLSYLVSQEALSLISSIEKGSFDSLATLVKHPAANAVVSKLLALFHVTEAEFQKAVVENAAKIGKEMAGYATSGLGNVASGAVSFVFMLLTTFFFLTDGPAFINMMCTFIPFSKKEQERLFQQTKDVIVSTIYGGITVAVAQGTIGGTAFALLGIPSPVLWGVAMFVTSFIPLFGTFVVWGPGIGYLCLQGLYLKGLILLLVGIFVISAADNIIRPLVIKGKLKMPTIAIFFSILGGIKLFGFIGFIMGPLVLALFVSVFEMFRLSEEMRSKQKAQR